MNDTVNTENTPFDLDALVAAGIVTDVTITEGRDGSDETVVHTVPAVTDVPVDVTVH
jgi:hypothetical protein